MSEAIKKKPLDLGALTATIRIKLEPDELNLECPFKHYGIWLPHVNKWLRTEAGIFWTTSHDVANAFLKQVDAPSDAEVKAFSTISQEE